MKVVTYKYQVSFQVDDSADFDVIRKIVSGGSQALFEYFADDYCYDGSWLGLLDPLVVVTRLQTVQRVILGESDIGESSRLESDRS